MHRTYLPTVIVQALSSIGKHDAVARSIQRGQLSFGHVSVKIYHHRAVRVGCGMPVGLSEVLTPIVGVYSHILNNKANVAITGKCSQINLKQCIGAFSIDSSAHIQEPQRTLAA
jgi:hypothetical protein